MTIQYYFPGVQDRTHITRAMIRDAGLADALSDLMTDAGFAILRGNINAVFKGPEGTGGMIVSPPRIDDGPQEIGYYPDRQTWTKFGDIWFGYGSDTTPASLRRLTPLIDGFDIELGDGNVWVAPRIGIPSSDVCWVPQTMGVNGSGEFELRVIDAYADAWKMAGEMLDVFFDRRDITTEQSYEYCTRCLALNYRVGPQELSALGVLTTENYPEVFRAAFDGELIQELFLKTQNDSVAEELDSEDALQKKSEPDDLSSQSPDTSDGPKDDCPDTVPPAENSGSSQVQDRILQFN